MKIAVVCRMDWKHESSGGAEAYLKEVLLRLVEDHDITVFSSNGIGLPKEEVVDGIRILRCGIETSSFAYANQAFVAYRYYRTRPNEDVLLVNGASNLFPLFRSKNRVDIYHLFSGRGALTGGPKSKIKYFLEWIAMRLPKGKQIAVSHNAKEKIERETPRRIDEVVHGGVDLEKYSGNVAKFEHPTILHIGRLGKQKGTDRVIDIHRAIQEQMDEDIYLHICGTGTMDSLAEEYASESETTTYHGYVSEAKKVELMQKSWLKLMPSRNESFGLVVLESNAAGTPVVSSDIAGLSDVIKDGVNGFCCSGEQIVDACMSILGDRSLRTELESQSKRHAKNYTWGMASRDFESILE